MPKINPYLIPKENIAKVEEVRYLDEQISPKIDFAYSQLPQGANVSYFFPDEPRDLTPEQQRIQELIEASYRGEREALREIASYGPGFWDEIGSPASKFLLSTFGAIAIVGTGGAAAPIVLGGAALAGGGKLAKELGKENKWEVVEWIGDVACQTGVGTLTGSIAGGSGSLASHISKETAKGGHVVAGVMRTAKFTHDAYGVAELNGECVYRKKHREHQERKVSYDSNCPVCTKSWPFNE